MMKQLCNKVGDFGRKNVVLFPFLGGKKKRIHVFSNSCDVSCRTVMMFCIESAETHPETFFLFLQLSCVQNTLRWSKIELLHEIGSSCITALYTCNKNTDITYVTVLQNGFNNNVMVSATTILVTETVA